MQYVPFCSLKRPVLDIKTCRFGSQNGTFGNSLETKRLAETAFARDVNIKMLTAAAVRRRCRAQWRCGGKLPPRPLAGAAWLRSPSAGASAFPPVPALVLPAMAEALKSPKPHTLFYMSGGRGRFVLLGRRCSRQAASRHGTGGWLAQARRHGTTAQRLVKNPKLLGGYTFIM